MFCAITFWDITFQKFRLALHSGIHVTNFKAELLAEELLKKKFKKVWVAWELNTPRNYQF